VGFFYHYQKIDEYKRKHQQIFFIGILRLHLPTNFSITKYFGNHQQEYVVGTYRGNQSWQIHGFVTTHTGGFILFISLAKRMVRFILITSIFVICCYL
jgi:hypothetical protein